MYSYTEFRYTYLVSFSDKANSLRQSSSITAYIHNFYDSMFGSTSISGISLDAAGLVALADLNTIAQRTAIVGSASLLDCLVLAPGIHRTTSGGIRNQPR
jgi:hypothetical protein